MLLLGILTFHSDWPPERWVGTYFTENDVGKVILLYSGLFFTFSLAYFLFPKMFHRQINAMLSQIHFWLNVIAFLVQLALPIYFNLFLEHPKEILGGLDRAFDSFFLGIKVLAVVQIVFLANVLWSVFKGERTSMKHASHKLEAEAYLLTTDELLKRMPKEQAVIQVQAILRLMEGSLDVPDIPAAKIRMERVLEELKRS